MWKSQLVFSCYWDTYELNTDTVRVDECGLSHIKLLSPSHTHWTCYSEYYITYHTYSRELSPLPMSRRPMSYKAWWNIHGLLLNGHGSASKLLTASAGAGTEPFISCQSLLPAPGRLAEALANAWQAASSTTRGKRLSVSLLLLEPQPARRKEREWKRPSWAARLLLLIYRPHNFHSLMRANKTNVALFPAVALKQTCIRSSELTIRETELGSVFLCLTSSPTTHAGVHADNLHMVVGLDKSALQVA